MTPNIADIIRHHVTLSVSCIDFLTAVKTFASQH